VEPWQDDERAKKQQQAERERKRRRTSVFSCVIKARLTVTQFLGAL